MTRHTPTPVREFLAEALAVRVHPTPDALAQDAAEMVRAHLQATLAHQEKATAILASATSQVRFLEALTALPDIDWSRITLFHMDEYLGISAEHSASFRRFMRERVEAKIRPRAFHYIQGDADEPLRECERYARLLAEQPMDLCCLGIGENGHVAFNDPHVADFKDPAPIKLVKLDVPCRQQQVGEGCFSTLAEVPQYAFTLTIPTLCSARRMVCVVPERRKAAAVRAALQGPITTACPASILRQQPHCTLFLDAESAALVSISREMRGRVPEGRGR